MTCKTMPPATTGEVVLVFQMTGAAAETGGCCILAETDCNAALGRHDWDTTTDDSGDATLMTGCGIVGACDVDGVECDDARCNRQNTPIICCHYHHHFSPKQTAVETNHFMLMFAVTHQTVFRGIMSGWICQSWT